jgi:transposase
VCTKVVESVSAEELMRHIQAKTRQGSVYDTEAFRGDQSGKRYGKHHTINHSKALVSRRQPRNHLNGIEGFWSDANHICITIAGSPNIISRCT